MDFTVALFLSYLFVFKVSNALNGFRRDTEFIDSFVCLCFSRFFFHLFTFLQYVLHFVLCVVMNCLLD